ncbi:putative NUDIX family hydrolase [Lichtheimia hyalospora FSU 10163]|nr:putative NUDIX family hydrolase [Lichtheimia hyalospora FSU 10163]
MTRTVNIGQQQVQLTGATPDIVDKVVAFQPFQDWVKRLDKEQRDRQNEMDITSIEIQSTDVFSSDKLGFVKFKANVKFKDTGKSAPGITFMRGGSVSVLTILRCNDQSDKEDQILLTLQPRIPVASLAFPEIPAGMLDGSGNFSGTAAREIYEETGLSIEEHELVDLTEKAYGNQWQGVYPSAGGCDEFLRLFMCIKHMSHADIQKLEGKLTGLRDRGENITLKLVPLKDAWRMAPDAKLLSSLALYHSLKEQENVVE